MACRIEQENIELREKLRLSEKKQSEQLNKIYELLTENKNGTDTIKQNSTNNFSGS